MSSLLCTLILFLQVSALTLSSQSLNRPIKFIEEYPNTLSALNTTSRSSNLTLPQSPYTYIESGYKVVYTISGAYSFNPMKIRRFTRQLIIYLDAQCTRRSCTDPIPNGQLTVTADPLLDLDLEWYIMQTGAAAGTEREKLTYYLAEVVSRGTDKLAHFYGSTPMKEYEFQLYALDGTTVIATGRLQKPTLSTTIAARTTPQNLHLRAKPLQNRPS